MTTTTETETDTLTREDITALRKADSIVFQITDQTGPVIRAIRRFREDQDILAADRRLFPEVDRTAYDERERHITGPVSGEVYTYDDTTSKHWGGSAFSMLHASQYSRRWATVLAFIKPGDALRLDFGGDRMSTDYVKKTGMHLDGFSLLVNRVDGRGTTQHYEFMLDVSLCPDNTARMVKPAVL